MKPLRRVLQEIAEQQRHVGAAFAKRRDADADGFQAIEQILTETPVCHCLGQVALGRRDDAQVDAARRSAADGRQFSLLDHAQQLALYRARHAVDLVEEQRAAIGVVDPATLQTPAEQRLVGKLVGQRGTVDRDELAAPPLAPAMQHPRDQFLAGAGLSLDQDIDLDLGQLAHRVTQG